MSPSAALLAITIACTPAAAPASRGAAEPPAAGRVRTSDTTKLELEVLLKPSLLDGPHATPTESRTIAFVRTAEGAPWTVERGLADGEVLGEAMLKRIDALKVADLRTLDATIASADAQSVTVVDLIEGDVAICLWDGDGIRAVYFATPLLALGSAKSAVRPSSAVLVNLARAKDAQGEPIARGALVAAQSRTPSVASFGRSRASAATVVYREGAPVARLELCQAVLDYAQPGVDPKTDAQFLLYFGLARALEGVAPPAKAASPAKGAAPAAAPPAGSAATPASSAPAG